MPAGVGTRTELVNRAGRATLGAKHPVSGQRIGGRRKHGRAEAVLFSGSVIGSRFG